MAGQPVAGATVTLYAAGTGAPTSLGQGKTDDRGAFKLNAGHETSDKVLYVVANGGTSKTAPTAAAKNFVSLLTVLGPTTPRTVTINELTTVASAFTAAQFIRGESHFRQ